MLCAFLYSACLRTYVCILLGTYVHTVHLQNHGFVTFRIQNPWLNPSGYAWFLRFSNTPLLS